MNDNINLFGWGIVIGIMIAMIMTVTMFLPIQQNTIHKDAIRAGVGQYNPTNRVFEWKSPK